LIDGQTTRHGISSLELCSGEIKSITYSELINGLFLLYFAMDFILITEILVLSIILVLQKVKKAVLKVRIDCETRAW